MNTIRLCLTTAILASFGAVAAPGAVAQSREVLSYRIEHQTHGDIGEFSNTIRRFDDRIVVEGELRIAVRFLFFTVYRQEADRKEVWKNGRLWTYESWTNDDGEVIEISGRADGQGFVIEHPTEEVTAPLDVFPTNLWSIEMKDANTVMGTKSGVVVDVTVLAEQQVTIEIDNQEIETRYFRIEPVSDPGVVPFPQEGWFDAAGIPVQFAVTKDGKRVVFTMTNYQQVLAGRSATQ